MSQEEQATQSTHGKATKVRPPKKVWEGRYRFKAQKNLKENPTYHVIIWGLDEDLEIEKDFDSKESLAKAVEWQDNQGEKASLSQQEYEELKKTHKPVPTPRLKKRPVEDADEETQDVPKKKKPLVQAKITKDLKLKKPDKVAFSKDPKKLSQALRELAKNPSDDKTTQFMVNKITEAFPSFGAIAEELVEVFAEKANESIFRCWAALLEARIEE